MAKRGDDVNPKLTDAQLLELIRHFSYDCCVVHDEAGIITFVSDSYQRITGHDPAQIIGEPISVLRERAIVEPSAGVQVLESKVPTTMMLDYKNGKDVIVTCIPVFDREEKLLAVVGNIRDITELNSLKERLAQSEYSSRRTTALLEEIKLHSLSSHGFIFNSPEMQQLFTLATRIAKVDSTVLITGESGVGKDVYAQLIQGMAQELAGRPVPYMKISCGAIPENLLESELFGYEYGAFTGAKKSGKPGIFELAEDGIVFLDEIGELPLTLQVKLLTVLQDRSFTRLGGVKPVKMQARIIAATNRDLEQAVAAGEFREDLYYRLNVIPVCIPPLRQRQEDVSALITSFLERFNNKYNMQRSLEPKALRLLERYSWPGNVRELANVVERIVVLSPSDLITAEMLPEAILRADTQGLEEAVDRNLPLGEFLEKMERFRIARAVEKEQTLRSAAEELGIDLSTLTRKLQKYNIPRRNQRKFVHTNLPKGHLAAAEKEGWE